MVEGRLVNGSNIAILIWLSTFGIVSGQNTAYMIQFRDKVNNGFDLRRPGDFLSAKSISRRAKFGVPTLERDLPVTKAYVDSLKTTGYLVLGISKWFNSALVQTDEDGLARISRWSFVQGSRQIADLGATDRADATCRVGEVNTDPVDFGLGRTQAHMLGIDSMHAAGYTGKGVNIAVMDAGFLNVQAHTSFQHLLRTNDIATAQDIVYPPTDVYRAGAHGGWVLSCIGGFYPGFFIGGSYKSTFHLFRTEDEASETERECFYWAVAAERADSLGVDIINTSLGYSIFDNQALSYRYQDLNGNTTLVTKAVNIATETGMLCVSSAGNEGASVIWRGKITSPADARLGLTVGAVGPDSVLTNFSSRGPAAGGMIKPDVLAQGARVYVYSTSNPTGISVVAGTSFSSPLTAGLLGGLMEQFPAASPAMWIEGLHQTSSKASSPDTLGGYGIPNYGRLATYMANRLAGNISLQDVLYPNPARSTLAWKVPISEVLNLEAISISGVRHRLFVMQTSQTILTDVSGLSSGMYMLEAQMKDGKPLRRRLVVARQ